MDSGGITTQQVVLRAQIVCGATQGQSDKATASALGIRRETARCGAGGCARKGSAACGRLPPDVVANALIPSLVSGSGSKPRPRPSWRRDTLERALDRAHGVSKNTIQRAWQDHGLKPHLTKSFKLSRDPQFLEKLTDVVGVYLTPPQKRGRAVCR
jgi:hypothetical protein